VSYELRELEIAEQECPWGEMAMNLRMEYSAAVTEAMNLADESARTFAWNRARVIELKLFGPQPSPPPQISELIREH
jgi:hypothetical protein